MARFDKIENSPNVIVKIASFIIRRKFGVVISPVKVIHARKPDLLMLTDKINQYEDRKIKLPQQIVVLVKAYCSYLNGCGFCQDLALARTLRESLSLEKFNTLSCWDDVSVVAFDKQEMAVLKAVKEYSESKKVSDEAFEALRAHFSEEEIIDIFTLNAIESFYNALNIPLQIGSDGLADLERRKVALP